MLLHLDVKNPGLDDEIARVLDDADMWDHVVAVNTETLPKLLTHPKLKLLRYKGPAYENREDVDPAIVRALLAKPGQMAILEDPRVAASQLKRPAYSPVPIPPEVMADSAPTAPLAQPRNAPSFAPMQYLRTVRTRIDPNSVELLMGVLDSFDQEERRVPRGTPEYEEDHAKRILERAWAAERLVEIEPKGPRIIAALEFQVRNPTLHPDWMYQGLDAFAAARGLGRLRATESASTLIRAFRKVDPALAQARNPQFTNSPLSWVDWRKKEIISVLGELPCEASKKFLREYVTLSEAVARELSIPQFQEASRALLRQPLSEAEIAALLKNSNSAVRGAAILECLDAPTPERTAAIRETTPWALELPKRKP
jgi:hypothetical protein